jgi:diguanylate cyclase (GGDEF)-like protein
MLRVECSRAARSRQALSVAIIAIDWFAEFNTRYGHESGDACLCQLARVLETGVMRSGDLIARYSGGAFVLLAPDTDTHGILSIANYLCQEVLRLGLPHQDSPYGCVSISIGVATANAQALGPDPHEPQGLLAQAESCLASAQVQGRNRACAF